MLWFSHVVSVRSIITREWALWRRKIYQSMNQEPLIQLLRVMMFSSTADMDSTSATAFRAPRYLAIAITMCVVGEVPPLEVSRHAAVDPGMGRGNISRSVPSQGDQPIASINADHMSVDSVWCWPNIDGDGDSTQWHIHPTIWACENHGTPGKNQKRSCRGDHPSGWLAMFRDGSHPWLAFVAVVATRLLELPLAVPCWVGSPRTGS